MAAMRAHGWVDGENSTTETLTSGTSYTGAWVSCAGFGSINIAVQTEQAAYVYAEFSVDKSTAFRTVQLSTGTTAHTGIHALIPISGWYRVRIANNYAGDNDIVLQR